ncbi:MAG: hypothetical protein PHI51_01780 [Candidatus Peribacteraceae bacterium]|nr:hypothetical protein [Candidatus Peribacteraceae bacterium]
MPYSILLREQGLLHTKRCATYGMERCGTSPKLERDLARRHALVQQLLAKRIPYEERNFNPPQ